MKISLLVPTRQRPDSFYEMCISILKTVGDTSKIEVVAYIDEDDTSPYMFINNIKIIRGPRKRLSEMWNDCQNAATGDIFMHASDDLRFSTIGWDIKVREAFDAYEDKIALVYGDDGFWGRRFGAHAFVHRNWVAAVGMFVPPYFSSRYDSVWLNDVARDLGRQVYVPNMATEYINHRIGIEKFSQVNHDDSITYQLKRDERKSWVRKLKHFIDTYPRASHSAQLEEPIKVFSPINFE